MESQRIAIIGSSASGKTTFAKAISQRLGIKHLELDAVFWEPGWKEPDPADFRARVKTALAAETWVVEGHFVKVKDLVLARADTVVWLDIPLKKVLFRFLVRSVRRACRREMLWNGCVESFHNSLFSQNSRLLWILKNFHRNRRDYRELMKTLPRAKMKFIRIRSNQDVARFLASVGFLENE